MRGSWLDPRWIVGPSVSGKVRRILIGMVLYFVLFAKEWERIIILGLGTLSLVFPHHYPPYLGYKIGDWMVFQAEKYFGTSSYLCHDCMDLTYSV